MEIKQVQSVILLLQCEKGNVKNVLLLDLVQKQNIVLHLLLKYNRVIDKIK